jgi:hypothetical protein
MEVTKILQDSYQYLELFQKNHRKYCMKQILTDRNQCYIFEQRKNLLFKDSYHQYKEYSEQEHLSHHLQLL